MKKIALIGSTVLLALIHQMALGNDLADNDSYAKMQNCLATAEQSFNDNSGLDHYCVNSYLATRPQTSDQQD